MRGLLQVLKTNCIRQPQRKLPTLSFNHYTLTTLEHPWGIHLLAIRAWKLLTATLKCIVMTLQMFWGLTVHCGCNRNWAASSWTISPQSKSITTVSPVCLQPGKPPCGLNTVGGGSSWLGSSCPMGLGSRLFSSHRRIGFDPWLWCASILERALSPSVCLVPRCSA